MKFKIVPESENLNKLYFHCPGCQCDHAIDYRWEFNGSMTKPTVSPSIVVHHTKRGKDIVCHSYVIGGFIQFLTDSTHELAGQTVELPDYDD